MFARRATVLILAAVATVMLPTAVALASLTPAVRITKIHYAQTGTNLDTEYIVFQNTTSTTQTITGWRIISSPSTDNQAYVFPTTRIAPGATLVLYTGRGTNTATKRYWGSRVPVWNNSGDIAVLRNKAGTTIDSCRYAGGGTTAYC